LSDQFDRTQAACIPVYFFAIFTRDQDVIANVRIPEPDFSDDALDCCRVVAVKFRGIGMMGEFD